MNSNEIILYQSDTLSNHIEVRIEDDTVWLTQLQMVDLFQSTKQNISLHITNILKEGELDEYSTVKEYLTVQQEGIRSIKRKVKIYNLDVIISVGYRVKSQRGTQFRIWANKILKEYLLKGYAINSRIELLEKKVNSIEIKNDEFDLILKTNLPPNQGVFYDGQIFDAYELVARIIKSAKKSIILIDNYCDESVLLLLSKREANVNVTIYTNKIEPTLQLDLDKHNQQYNPISIQVFKKAHDRFLIIDNEELYHIGASLKDLGKKWFAFSKLNVNVADLLSNLL
ncbi:virulence RhuM family protein [Flavobacterium laiguense]|uniref:DNA-binding protein n=1 Tax=Flavobacterium laiguense TaxID=2169409 RepID=A0A2U1JYQ5_9FLAO|nr:RhuM family protein [Flavobacterium laiguense]PWA09903.1 DNA-binding protein [Flavobacterium laiguense]